ncbi:MAG TPA: D-alanyl-D-alanine carboxypeptidase family protein [Stellaceae bacterium]|nr:D-alanyl-D-alanine carboxypeptidase family protein [Stellaceae bacterium]
MLTSQGKRQGGGRSRRVFGIALLAGVVALGLGAAPPAAAHHRYRMTRPAASSGPVFEWIVLNAETGQVLGEQNADALTYPASLTKMMTLYLTFEALNQGRITLDTRFYVSPYAASRAPTKLGLAAGDTVSVRSLILGIVTKSANDAATVLAEGLGGGSDATFCRYMNWTAHQLGMDHTYYDNASGLPDPLQRTTARDIARLALALYHQFPREYRYFATKEFEFRGQIVRGHDHLLDWYPGADGIKTGFIDASGFNLASSAVRNGHRLIGVIMGGRTARIRDMQMASLLDQGFAILDRGQPAQVAAAPPIAAAPAVAAAAPVAVAAARPAAVVVERAATAERKPDLVHTALRHLAPVSPAEAAPLADRTARDADARDWAIQIGAFRAPAAARHAAREVAHLAIARGKPRQILAPAKAERRGLYRARLLHFTERAAENACAELRRRGFACTVLGPGTARVAS